MAGLRRRNGRVGCRRLAHAEGEGTADRHAAKDCTVPEILGEEQRAALKLCRADDYAVPPGEPMALLDFPPEPLASQVLEPGFCPWLLDRLVPVASVEQDVGVNEDGNGHAPRLG